MCVPVVGRALVEAKAGAAEQLKEQACVCTGGCCGLSLAVIAGVEGKQQLAGEGAGGARELCGMSRAGGRSGHDL